MYKRSKKWLSLFLVAAIVCGLFSMAMPVYAADPFVVAIDPYNQHKTWDGFGTSFMLWANQLGHNPDEDEIDELLDMAFGDPETSLGMNVLRYNIGGGPDGGKSIEQTYAERVTAGTAGPGTAIPTPWNNITAPGPDLTYEPGYCGHASNHTGHWGFSPFANMEGYVWNPPATPGVLAASDYKWDSDVAQRKVFEKAVELAGDEALTVAFSNSPPWWMTNSQCTSGGVSGANNLPRENFPIFADYLTEVVKHFDEEWGITFDYLVPTNEPDGGWGARGYQEGCSLNAASTAELAPHVGAALVNKGLKTQLNVADCTAIHGAVSYANAMNNVQKSYVGLYSTHSYSGGATDRIAMNNIAKQDGKPLWMTEWGPWEGGSTWTTVCDHNRMNGSFGLANNIIDFIKEADVSAYVIWQLIEEEDRAYGGAYGANTGLMHGWVSPGRKGASTMTGAPTDASDPGYYTSFEPTRQYYTMWQFSRFIRPGDIIIDAGHQKTVAAMNPDTGKVTIVVNNDGSTAQDFLYDLSNFAAVGATASVYTTASTKDMEKGTDIAVNTTEKSFSANVPANSVVTFVIETGCEMEPDMPEVLEVNDNTTGKGTNQIQYTGSWQIDKGWSNGAFHNDIHWTETKNSSATLYFNGTQVKYYVKAEPHSGIAAVSIDGGPETLVDLYSGSSATVYQKLVYTSPVLNPGNHTLTIRATGNKNAASSNIGVTIDKVDVFGTIPEPEPEPEAPKDRIEAEDYSRACRVGTQGSSPEGVHRVAEASCSGEMYLGNFNMGSTPDPTVWVEYNDIVIPEDGEYTIDFWIASGQSGHNFTLSDVTGGTPGTTLLTVPVSNTGGWTTFRSSSFDVTLTAGTKVWRIASTSGNYTNFDYFTITPKTAAIKIEAESFTSAIIENTVGEYGVQKKAEAGCSGGMYVGNFWKIPPSQGGDDTVWMEFNNIVIPENGQYTIDFKIACGQSGHNVKLVDVTDGIPGTTLITIPVTNTGGWTTFTSFPFDVDLTAGNKVWRIVSESTNYTNFDYFTIKLVSGEPEPNSAYVSYTAVQRGGANGTANTTGIRIAFGSDVAGLTADDITVTGATKGTLTNNGDSDERTWLLGISDITAANGETVKIDIADFLNEPTNTTYVVLTAPQAITVYKKLIPVEAVSVSPTTLSIQPGYSYSLVATVTPTDATDKGVTWESSDDSIATVDERGVVTAVDYGEVTITVTTDDGGFEAECEVTVEDAVTPPVYVDGVSLDLSTANLIVGGTQILTATISPSNATDKGLIWESDAESVAIVVNGVVIAKSAGTAIITVRSVDGGFEAECEITVEDTAAPPVNVAEVSVSPTSASLLVGGTKRLTATVSPSNATNKGLIWESDDESIATVVNGLVTARSIGTATITVKTVDGGFEAYCDVTVTANSSGQGNGSSRSSGGGGSGQTYIGPAKPVEPIFTPLDRAKSLGELGKAQASGSAALTVRQKNVSTASLALLQEITKNANGKKVDLVADSMYENAVDVRVSFDPANVTKGMTLSGSTRSSKAKLMQTKFTKWFGNKIEIVQLDHKGEFGMTVKVAAKVSLTGMNTGNLYFYSYDAATNIYRRIMNPKYYIDTNGYLHFYTPYGDTIVISDGPLEKK